MIRTLVYLVCISGLIILLNSSCKKTDTANPSNSQPLPVLTTVPVNTVTPNSAFCGGKISSNGGYAISASGVCWSSLQNPTIADNKTSEGTSDGTFTSVMVGLTPNTTYYVRAYAINKEGTGYGDQLTFTTEASNPNIVKDVDGNVYHTVTIGVATWMVENLKTSRYSDGTPITRISDNSLWGGMSAGAYGDYWNTASYSVVYGKLYNWFAVDDNRGLAPAGWHVASSGEWEELISDLGAIVNLVGGKMKEAGTSHWSSPNTGATNESGLTALPGGIRSIDGSFSSLHVYGQWWSSSPENSEKAIFFGLFSDNASIFTCGNPMTMGSSVRCVKDY